LAVQQAVRQDFKENNMYELTPTDYGAMSSPSTGIGGMTPSTGGLNMAGAGASSMNPMMMAMALGGLKGLNSQPKGQFVDLGQGYKAYVKTPFTDKLQSALGGAAEAGLGMALQQQMADASRKSAMEDYMAKETVRQGFEMAQDRKRDMSASLRQENQRTFQESMAKAADERETQRRKAEQVEKNAREDQIQRQKDAEAARVQYAEVTGESPAGDMTTEQLRVAAAAAKGEGARQENARRADIEKRKIEVDELNARNLQSSKGNLLDYKERTTVARIALERMKNNPKLSLDQALMEAEEMHAKSTEEGSTKPKQNKNLDVFQRAEVQDALLGK